LTLSAVVTIRLVRLTIGPIVIKYAFFKLSAPKTMHLFSGHIFPEMHQISPAAI